MAEEGFDVSATAPMAKRLVQVLSAARNAGVLPIFVRSFHSTQGDFFLSDVWLEQARRRRRGSYTERPVCAPGSWGAEFFDEIEPTQNEPIITKHRYSAFWATDLELLLRSRSIRTIVVTGVATNVCVETTVRDAFARDFFVVLVKDATAAYSQPEHLATIQTIDVYFGEVTDAKTVLGAWKGRSPRSHRPESGKPAPSRARKGLRRARTLSAGARPSP